MWAKASAIALVVGLVAIANLTAAGRERRRERVAANTVAATAVLTGTSVRVGEGFVDAFVGISNTGPRLRIGPPRVDAAGVVVEAVGQAPTSVPTGATRVLGLRLHASCLDGRIAIVPPVSASLVLAVVPPSGRTHQLRVDTDALLLRGLFAQACGVVPPDEAIEPQVTTVRGAPFYVDFGLRLHNRSTRPVTLRGLAGEGLALSVRGGLPTTIGPRTTTTLPVRLAVPSCAQLPEPLDAQRIDALEFSAFELELVDETSRPVSLPYQPDPGTELYAAVRTLAHAICPRAVL